MKIIEKKMPEEQNIQGFESQAQGKAKLKRKKRVNIKKINLNILKSAFERAKFLSTSLDEAKKNEDCAQMIYLAREEAIDIPEEAITQIFKLLNSITFKYFMFPNYEELKTKYDF